MSEKVATYTGPASVRPQADGQLPRGLLLVSSVAVAAIGLWQLGAGSHGQRDWPIGVTAVCCAWLVVYSISSYLYFRVAYLFSTFYVAVLILFHLSAPIVDAVGWYPGLANAAEISPKWLELSGWYVILSLGSFGSGLALSLRQRKRAADQSHESYQNRASLFQDGIGLLIISAGLLTWAFYTAGNLLTFSRADLFRGVGDTRGLGVFLMIFPSALVLVTLGATSRTGKVFAAVLALAGFVLVMLSGYRTSALYPLVVGAIVWRKLGRRIPSTLAAGGVIVLMLAASFVGLLRQGGSYASIDRTTIQAAAEKASPTDTVRLGQTGALLAHVLRLVPTEEGYRYGTSYLEALRRSVPNVTSEIAESSRQTVKRAAFSGARVSQLAPSDWLTYHIAPWAFDIGQGVGFTAIGEAYLNFGTAGVVGFFGLLGFFFGRLDQVDLASHPGCLLFAAAFLWHLVRTVRDDFANFTKPAVFTLLFIIVWRLAMRISPFRIK